MRVLAASCLALTLTGCSLLGSPGTPSSAPEIPKQVQQSVSHSAPPVLARVYKNTADLLGKPFRDLGEVNGDACQITTQDPPPAIPIARRRMQINAAKMQANAVLQHRCEIISGTPGCYRQAVCLGSALDVTN